MYIYDKIRQWSCVMLNKLSSVSFIALNEFVHVHINDKIEKTVSIVII